jgi:FPC/CPF motif-containing protein YcgG
MTLRPPRHAILSAAARKPQHRAAHAPRHADSHSRPPQHSAEAAFQAFLSQASFPCVGAKAALARGGIETLQCRSITSAWDDLAIAGRLLDFAHRWKKRPTLFSSFVVLFDGPRTLDERQFERALWDRIQSLTDKDRWLGQRPDPRASEDPADPHFALSFGGEAFFAIGLHPRASRKARRFRSPAIVFNLHDQFRQLRADGRYEPMRSTILERDKAWSGSVNPMLGRHGEKSEAPQYSGRQVEGDWVCPFRPR